MYINFMGMQSSMTLIFLIIVCKLIFSVFQLYCESDVISKQILNVNVCGTQINCTWLKRFSHVIVFPVYMVLVCTISVSEGVYLAGD